MAKNYFDPFVLLFGGLDDGDDEQEGKYSGQTAVNPYPCSFEDWQSLFSNDNNNDSEINFADYQIWFQNMFAGDHDEGQIQWERFNSGPLFPGDTPPIDPEP